MLKFNERSFLIRALVGVFVIQFATVAYQIFSCQTAIKTSKESEQVSVVCNNATTSLNETGKMALTTFLALLVPSASQAASATLAQTSANRRKTKADSEGEGEGIK